MAVTVVGIVVVEQARTSVFVAVSMMPLQPLRESNTVFFGSTDNVSILLQPLKASVMLTTEAGR